MRNISTIGGLSGLVSGIIVSRITLFLLLANDVGDKFPLMEDKPSLYILSVCIIFIILGCTLPPFVKKIKSL